MRLVAREISVCLSIPERCKLALFSDECSDLVRNFSGESTSVAHVSIRWCSVSDNQKRKDLQLCSLGRRKVEAWLIIDDGHCADGNSAASFFLKNRIWWSVNRHACEVTRSGPLQGFSRLTNASHRRRNEHSSRSTTDCCGTLKDTVMSIFWGRCRLALHAYLQSR